MIILVNYTGQLNWVNKFNKDLMMILKQRFLEAVVKGELGSIEDRGVVVTLKGFKKYFSDVKTDYINSFLPASTIEPGRVEMTKTRFLLRIASGVYIVHPDAIDQFIEQQMLHDDIGDEAGGDKEGGENESNDNKSGDKGSGVLYRV